MSASQWGARGLEAAGAGVLVTDGRGRVVVANAVARSWFGVSDVGELGDQPLGQATALAADQVTPLRAGQLPIAHALRGQMVEGFELVLVHPAGSERQLWVNATPIRDAGGAVEGAVVVGWDVTSVRDDETRSQRLVAQMSAMAAARHGVLVHQEPRAAVTRAIVEVTGAVSATILEVRAEWLEITAHAGRTRPRRMRLDQPSVPREVLESGKPRVVADTSTAPAECWVPVHAGDLVVGVLCTVSPPDTYPHEKAMVDVMQLMAAEVTIAIERDELHRRLTAQALTDELTGLPNLRAWRAALIRMPRQGGLAIVDLDHFKSVNDRAGHAAGDEVLYEFAQALQSTTRTEDLVARIGGEEFGVICPKGTDVAVLIARLRARWTEISRGHSIPVTFSAGVATRGPDEGPDRAQGRADQALYAAKQAGRDRCVVAVNDPVKP